ncbi:MAG: histidine triad nucleotide-binding protein [Gammaproteobacteria bacterium]|nr:histidine triad nucleotide-binding protein [Gammaproteobacteria bacterium]
MSDCLFCKIRDGEIPADVIYKDADLIAFRDIHPKAPVHFLVIPRRHIANLFDVSADDEGLMGRIQLAIPTIAREQGLDSGFRTVLNTGPGGHQEVYHMHYHVLGGGPFTGFN